MQLCIVSFGLTSADPLPEQHSEGSAALEVSMCVCMYTVWEHKLPKLAVLPAELMIAT